MDTPKNLLAPPGSVNKNLLAPQGVWIRAYLAPSRGLNKNLLAPPKCELHAVLIWDIGFEMSCGQGPSLQY